jgi:pimeloyl-ACP methyl ester carboxylesterase
MAATSTCWGKHFRPRTAYSPSTCQGRGESAWLADPNDYVFPTYLTTLTALIARSGADTVDWIGTSMGGLLGIAIAAQPGSPIARLVVNDVGPAIEAVALQRIGGYIGQDPTFGSYAEIETYIAPCPRRSVT